MKWLCTLLAFMVLLLSAQPVCANITRPDQCCNTGSNCEEAQDDTDNDHKEDCSSGCNPFQLCSCCAFCVLTPAQAIFNIFSDFPIPGMVWGSLQFGVPDEPVSSFWQPPRQA